MENSFIKIFAKNSLWLIGGEIANGLLMSAVTIWLARYLGASAYGQLSFALSLTAVLAVLADGGLSALAVREIARAKEATARYVGNILTIKFFLGLVTFGLILIIGQLINGDPTARVLLYLIGAWEIFHSAIIFLRAVFRAHERMQYEAITRIIHAFLLFIAVVYFIWRRAELLFFGWAYCLAGITTTALAAYLVWKKFSHWQMKLDWALAKKMLSASWPFALTVIFTSIYYYLDSVMLGIMGQSQAVGWYNAAYKIIMFILILGGILPNAAFPIIARLYQKSRASLQIFMQNFARLIITLVWPMAAGGIILAPALIKLIYGEEYLPGALALQILLATTAFIYLSMIFGPSLQACDRQKIFLVAVGGGAGLNILLNFLLIPSFSLNGAATATLLTEMTVFLIIYWQFRKKIVAVKIARYFPRPLLAAGAMSVILFCWRELNIFFLLLLGAAIYGTFLILIRGLNKKDFILVKEIFLKRGSK